MPEPNESSDEIWELAEFCAREAMLLRSFVEYLRTWPHPAEKKMERCKTGSRKLGFCLETPACQTLCLGYSNGYGPHPRKHGKQFSKKLLRVCIPLIFLVQHRTPQIPFNRLSARTSSTGSWHAYLGSRP